MTRHTLDSDNEADVAALAFSEFARVNRERCESPEGFGHPLSGWSTSDWFLAAVGEFGEAANKAKKLNRVRDGIPGNTESPDELRAGLADEIADAVIYLDLLAQSLGFDLGSIVASKFNRTSEKLGAPQRLLPASPAPLLDRERLEPCQVDERCYRSDGHKGEHAYPDEAKP